MTPKQIDADYDREAERLSARPRVSEVCDLHRDHLLVVNAVMESYWKRSDYAAVRAALLTVRYSGKLAPDRRLYRHPRLGRATVKRTGPG